VNAGKRKVARDLRTTEQKLRCNLKLRLCEIINSAATALPRNQNKQVQPETSEIQDTARRRGRLKQPLQLVATVWQEATSHRRTSQGKQRT